MPPRRRIDPQQLRDAVAAVAGWLDGTAPEPERAELAAAVRLSLRTLQQLAPGHAVEVRVPPFAAVQCLAGPRHVRGTPPNVVETDPHTWLALATGRVSWARAVEQGRVAATGTRADLSGRLPLLRTSADARTMTSMTDTLSLHATALEEFDRRVRAIGSDQWHEPTPCSDWDVRALVDHLVTEQLWVPLLLDGATIEDVGDRFDGDQLGDDPIAAWSRASAAARQAFTVPGALHRPVELSYGRRPAEGYCQEMTIDLAVHAWDLARGIGADERLDDDLVDAVHEWVRRDADHLAAIGLFDPPVPVAEDADTQSRLLAALGRHP